MDRSTAPRSRSNALPNCATAGAEINKSPSIIAAVADLEGDFRNTATIASRGLSGSQGGQHQLGIPPLALPLWTEKTRHGGFRHSRRSHSAPASWLPSSDAACSSRSEPPTACGRSTSSKRPASANARRCTGGFLPRRDSSGPVSGDRSAMGMAAGSTSGWVATAGSAP